MDRPEYYTDHDTVFRFSDVRGDISVEFRVFDAANSVIVSLDSNDSPELSSRISKSQAKGLAYFLLGWVDDGPVDG